MNELHTFRVEIVDVRRVREGKYIGAQFAFLGVDGKPNYDQSALMSFTFEAKHAKTLFVGNQLTLTFAEISDE